jgi:hypothetical protein
MEAATNPFMNAWSNPPITGEIGNKSAWKFGRTINGANVIWNNDPYIVQEEWDNARSACVLAGP